MSGIENYLLKHKVRFITIISKGLGKFLADTIMKRGFKVGETVRNKN